MAAAQKGGSGKVMVAMVVAGDEQAGWQARLAKNGECMHMVIKPVAWKAAALVGQA